MTRNEAAERLRRRIKEAAFPMWPMAHVELHEALATERRLTVERVRERLGPMGPDYDEPWPRIRSILDDLATAAVDEATDAE